MNEGKSEAVKVECYHACAIRVLSTRLFLVFIVVCDWNILSIELQILMMSHERSTRNEVE